MDARVDVQTQNRSGAAFFDMHGEDAAKRRPLQQSLKVSTTYGHRDVLVRGYVHEVVIACGTEMLHLVPAATPRHDGLSVPAEGHNDDGLGARLHGPAGESWSMTDIPKILMADQSLWKRPP